MGKVIGPGKKQPDGRKIADLRKQRGWRQKTLWDKVRISERLLRDIERKNYPIHATTLTEIATALGVTADEITLPPPDGTPDKSATLLKLKAIRSASDLTTLADSADGYDYLLKVSPTVATGECIRQVMVIVRRLVSGWEPDFDEPIRDTIDEFDKVPFGQISRLARLQELLKKLRKGGVGVIAGTHVQQRVARDIFGLPIPGHDDLTLVSDITLLVRFVPSEVEEEVITIEPGRSLKELLDEYYEIHGSPVWRG